MSVLTACVSSSTSRAAEAGQTAQINVILDWSKELVHAVQSEFRQPKIEDLYHVGRNHEIPRRLFSAILVRTSPVDCPNFRSIGL